jgi:protein-S-isoprenylcysteine O-methyltransferase Ste14
MKQPITYPKVMPPMALLCGILLMLALHFTFPVIQIALNDWRLLGLSPLVFGLIISYAAERHFRQAGTTVNPSGKTSQLVTDGFFRYSRNPMYLGMVLILLGVAWILGSLTPFGVIPLFIWWIGTQFIHREEDSLATQFGDDWLEYKSKVRRWV